MFAIPFSALSALLLLLSYLLPNHYLPWATFYNELLAFYALLFALLSVARRSRLILSTPVIVLLIIATVPLLQWAFGTVLFFGDALMASLYLLGSAAAITVGLSGANKAVARNGLETVAWTMLGAAVVSTCIALCQWLLIAKGLFVVELPIGGRPYANLAQPNNLATLLSMALVAALYLYEIRKLGAWTGALLAFFLLFGLALTQSRTPWLASLAISFFWWLKAAQCGVRVSPRLMMSWCGIYGLLVFALPNLSEALLLTSSNPLQRAQSLHRLDLWWQLFQAILQGSLWGYGWNQVSIAQVSVSLAFPVQLMTEHSHNILLDLLLWNGPVLGGVIIVFLIAWLGRLAWRLRTVDSLCCLLSIGVVLTHGMLEFPLEYAFFLLPVGLLLGVVTAEVSTGLHILIPRYLVMGIVLLWAGLLGWIWHEYRVLEEDHRLMRFETAGIGTLKATQAAPNVLLLTQLREFIRYARTPAAEGMDAGQLEWMKKVAHRHPYSPSLSRYALALALNGQPDNANRQLLIIRSLHGAEPYNEAVQAFRALRDKYPQPHVMSTPVAPSHANVSAP